jgi:N-methylhydantoinase A
VQVIADCRYVGQGHEIRVGVPVKRLTKADGRKLKAEFERLYEQVYGLRIPNQEAEAITWSVTVSSQAVKPKRAARAAAKPAPKPRSKRTIYDPALGKQVQAPVYWRFDMKAGSRIKGPAIIAEDETSTIVGANFRASVNSLGYIVLERSR